MRSLSSGGITDRSANPTHLGAEGTSVFGMGARVPTQVISSLVPASRLPVVYCTLYTCTSSCLIVYSIHTCTFTCLLHILLSFTFSPTGTIVTTLHRCLNRQHAAAVKQLCEELGDALHVMRQHACWLVEGYLRFVCE